MIIEVLYFVNVLVHLELYSYKFSCWKSLSQELIKY